MDWLGWNIIPIDMVKRKSNRFVKFSAFEFCWNEMRMADEGVNRFLTEMRKLNVSVNFVKNI